MSKIPTIGEPFEAAVEGVKEPQLISERIYMRSQSWCWEAVVKVGKDGIYRSEVPSDWKRMRIKIRRNAYDEQSHAQVELWNGSEWNEVVRTPIDKLRCKAVSYVHDKPDVHLFQLDGRDLLREAVEIVLL